MMSSPMRQQQQQEASELTRPSSHGTVKVRNVSEGVVYHLTFDGDIGRLSGQLLKQHVSSIAGIPVAAQHLSFNGVPFADEALGSSVGLRDGSAMILHVDGSRATSVARTPVHTSRTPSQPVRPLVEAVQPPSAAVAVETNGHAHERRKSSGAAQIQQLSQPAATASIKYPNHHDDAPPHRRAAERAAPLHQDGGGGGDSSDDVEVEVLEESAAPRPAWFPSRSADLEEMVLQQQDYVWRMEQVRFETERMTREREMRRQQQELEYQAALLDRERLELERHTLAERAEFDELQAHERIDLDIEARYAPHLLNYYGGTRSGLLPSASSGVLD